MGYKHPVSVLVVIFAQDTGRVLMLQRRDDSGFWQSVTGSLEAGKPRCRRRGAKCWKSWPSTSRVKSWRWKIAIKRSNSRSFRTIAIATRQA